MFGLPELNDLSVNELESAGLAILGALCTGYQAYKKYKTFSFGPKHEGSINKRGGNEEEELVFDKTTDQEVLSLLYLIAEDQAKRTGYIHRGVSCNTCGMSPIKGIRYHCSECADVDLCQKCEASGRHNKMHILLKIKVPVPLMKSPRWIRKTFRPASSVKNFPQGLLAHDNPLPESVSSRLSCSLIMSFKEIEIAYERFLQYADKRLSSYVSDLSYGISCGALRKALLPHDPNGLMAERIASMYDKDGDGIVRFEEFIDVIDNIIYGSQRGAISRALMAYKVFDLDGTGYISKHNVGRVLSSYYNMVKDLVSDFPEADIINSKIREGALSNPRPLSSYFGHDISAGTILPEKSSSLSSAVSIQQLTVGKSPSIESSDPRTADRYTRAFGRQGNRDMDDHSRLMLVQWTEAVWRDFEWPDPVEYSPTMFGIHGELIRKYHSDPLCDWLSLCVL